MITVDKASIVVAMRGLRGRPVGINGLVIEFTTTENVKPDDVYYLNYKDENYYFLVRELSTAGEYSLELKATEYGYWAEYLKEKVEGLDIRELVGLNLTQVKDEGKLSQLQGSNAWT